MAAELPQNGHVDIKEVVRCMICRRELSQKLIQLDCLHSCHKICLRSKMEDGSISCTACYKKYKVPKDGVDAIPEELLQYKIKDISEFWRDGAPSCKECELLGDGDIETVSVCTHFCIDCKYHLCSDDAISHTVFPDHKIVQISDITTEQYLLQILESKEAACFEHYNAKATKVCLNCKVPLCQACADTDHETHTTTSIINQELSQKFREEMKNKTAEIQDQKDRGDIVIDQLEKLLNSVENNSKEQIEKYEKWGNELKQIIDRIVSRNVQSISSTMQAEIKDIKEIMDTCKTQNKQYQSTQEYMKLFLRFGSDMDCLQKYKIFLKNLNECLEQKPKIEVKTTKFEVQLKDVSKFEKNLEKMVKLVTEEENHEIPVPRLRGCNLISIWETDNVTSGLVVCEEDVLICDGAKIKVHGMNGERKHQIECEGLRHAEDIEIINNQLYVIDSDPKKREILVLDKHGNIGRKINLPKKENELDWPYELCLAVDHSKEDVFIASAGTNILYKCAKGQTMAHPFVKDGLNIPLYLCVTPSHEVIVSNERSQSVTKHNSDGTLIWTYEGSLNRPAGVCSDTMGYVFVCDWSNDCIHYLSPEGKLLSYVNIGENILIQRPLAVTFKNEKIFIAGKGHIYVVQCQYN